MESVRKRKADPSEDLKVVSILNRLNDTSYSLKESEKRDECLEQFSYFQTGLRFANHGEPVCIPEFFETEDDLFFRTFLSTRRDVRLKLGSRYVNLLSSEDVLVLRSHFAWRKGTLTASRKSRGWEFIVTVEGVDSDQIYIACSSRGLYERLGTIEARKRGREEIMISCRAWVLINPLNCSLFAK